jgi:hypothetical protein
VVTVLGCPAAINQSFILTVHKFNTNHSCTAMDREEYWKVMEPQASTPLSYREKVMLAKDNEQILVDEEHIYPPKPRTQVLHDWIPRLH